EASYHRLRALQLQESGKTVDALKSFEDALEHDPKNPDLLQEAGQAALQVRDFQLAREYLDRAVNLAPSNSLVRRTRGEAVLASGDPERALSDLLEAARLDASDPAPHRLLARAYEQLHRPEAEQELHLAESLEKAAVLPESTGVSP